MNKHLRLGLALIWSACLAAAASAATVDVTTTLDEADGSCLDGDCSLRDAVATAAAGDTVAVPAGSYLLSIGQIAIPRNMTIAGAGARATILQGNGSARHFSIASAATTVTLSGLALTGGRGATGGAINSNGNLTLRAVALYGNQADIAGAINSNGTLTVIDSAITGNSARSVGGIYNDVLPIAIENSTISGNTAQLLGGGLALIGPTSIVHSTIAGNSVTSSPWQGGGGFLVGSPTTITGSVFDGNSPANCAPDSPTASASLDSDGSCDFTGPGNVIGVTAQLAALANNGGPTDTRALAAASPAVDLAPGCGLAHDQRGVARPQGPACDAGAYERTAQVQVATLCVTETFTAGLGDLVFANVGDSDQGGALTSGGRLQLTADGSAFYHGSDNGGFLHRSVSGDFRAEIELTGFPSNTGGGYRRSGLTVRTGTGPNDPRVYVEFLPQHPSYGQSALMFDYRGLDGVARELGSTKLGLALPLRLAIDRRGDKFTVWYKAGSGDWVKPAGGAGGTATIAMPAGVEVGPMQASYDTSITLTAEFDDFQVCRPNPAPLPPLPPPVACTPGQPLDLVYLVDASGSSPGAFPGGPTKLDAARAAIARLNTRLAADLPGSRVAIVTFQGGPAPAYATGAGATVRSGLTTDFAAAEAAAAAINPAAINTTTSSPLSHGLAAARQLLETTGNPAARPAVLLLGDGFVNVDRAGNGPLSYKNAEMAAISLIDGLAYRTIGQTAWLGNWNGGPATWDGEALANAMAEGLFLKQQLPTAELHTLGLHSDALYRVDLLGFLADYGAGIYQEATDSSTLEVAADTIYAGLSCLPPCAPPPADLISWWDGDHGSGGTVADLAGPNPGTRMGGAGAGVGRVGNAIQLDGVDDTVQMADHSSLSFGNATFDRSFTIEAWVRRNSLGRTVVIFSKYDSFASPRQQEYALRIRGTDNRLQMMLFDTSGDYRIWVHTTASLDLGWHHVAATYDGSGAAAGLRLYIDGVPQATAVDDDSALYVAMEDTASQPLIGAVRGSASPELTDFFDGLIDELSVYGRALGADEIAAIHLAGGAGKCK